MNCPKCNTEVPAGATHCRRCGAALTAKAAASSASDEIDLLPLEPSKPPAHSSFEPPANLLQPPGPPGTKSGPADPQGPPGAGYVPKIRGANASPPKSNLNLIIGGILLVLLVGFIGWRLLRTENKAIGKGAKLELTTIMLQPNQSRVENFVVTGKVSYTFEVAAPDSEILIGVIPRDPKDPTSVAALKKLPEGFEPVKKGDSRTLTGDLTAGQYSWVLINDGKKSARAKAKFGAQ